jgi:hypothetical protein
MVGAQAFTDATAALYAASPLTRTSIKYRVDGGATASVLTLKATNGAKVRSLNPLFRRCSPLPLFPPLRPQREPPTRASPPLQTLTLTERTRDGLRFMDKLSLLALNSSFSAAAGAAAAASAGGGGGGGSSGASAPKAPPAGSGAQRRKAARAAAQRAGLAPKAPAVKKARARARERAAERRRDRKLAAGAGATS